MSKPSVFISYSQRDSVLAGRIEQALAQLGLEASSSGHLPSGEDWRKEIGAAIKQADAVVMLIASPYGATSSWKGYEAGMAEALGKKVMVLLPNKYSAADLPADIASWRILDFDPEAPELAARHIFEQLAA